MALPGSLGSMNDPNSMRDGLALGSAALFIWNRWWTIRPWDHGTVHGLCTPKWWFHDGHNPL